jgi:hypothetical protein
MFYIIKLILFGTEIAVQVGKLFIIEKCFKSNLLTSKSILSIQTIHGIWYCL